MEIPRLETSGHVFCCSANDCVGASGNVLRDPTGLDVGNDGEVDRGGDCLGTR